MKGGVLVAPVAASVAATGTIVFAAEPAAAHRKEETLGRRESPLSRRDGRGTGPVRRLLVVLAVASVAASGLFLYVGGPVAAALSKTWTSDADFGGGTFVSTEVVGTGDAASIRLRIDPVLNWILMEPEMAPSPRRGVAMTYDEGDGVVLAFGGILPDL